jgi:hypothetical protein
MRLQDVDISGQETRAQRGRVPGWRTTNNCATSKHATDGPYQPNDPAPSATDPTRQRGAIGLAAVGDARPRSPGRVSAHLLARSRVGLVWAHQLPRSRVGLVWARPRGSERSAGTRSHCPNTVSLKTETCQETLSESPIAPIILPTRCNCLQYNNKGRIHSISTHCFDCRADTL